MFTSGVPPATSLDRTTVQSWIEIRRRNNSGSCTWQHSPGNLEPWLYFRSQRREICHYSLLLSAFSALDMQARYGIKYAPNEILDRSAIIITSVRHPATQNQHRGKIFDCEVAGSIRWYNFLFAKIISASCSRRSWMDGHRTLKQNLWCLILMPHCKKDELQTTSICDI